MEHRKEFVGQEADEMDPGHDGSVGLGMDEEVGDEEDTLPEDESVQEPGVVASPETDEGHPGYEYYGLAAAEYKGEPAEEEKKEEPPLIAEPKSRLDRHE